MQIIQKSKRDLLFSSSPFPFPSAPFEDLVKIRQVGDLGDLSVVERFRREEVPSRRREDDMFDLEAFCSKTSSKATGQPADQEDRLWLRMGERDRPCFLSADSGSFDERFFGL
jgi:hypothetical protein